MAPNPIFNARAWHASDNPYEPFLCDLSIAARQSQLIPISESLTFCLDRLQVLLIQHGHLVGLLG